MRRKVVIINSNYPSENNKYGDGFVHSRLLHYLPELDVQVIGYKESLKEAYHYNYEGVNVEVVSSKKSLVEKIKEHNPDLLGFHFIEGWMVKDIVEKFNNTPSFIWIHGFEALKWHRRLFNLELNVRSILSFANYIVSNTIQLSHVKKLIKVANRGDRIKFIFVSDWMRRITEEDCGSKIKNYSIIPNPIDPVRFKFIQKEENHRRKVLLIRPFHNKKYANDIAIEAIQKLSKTQFFDALEFTIYGKGKLFNNLVNKVAHLKNVKIYNDFVENKDIPVIHKDYGIFLCPTRQDAQGVSMCEAMSSGLVPISSNNTAIPEFLLDGKTGFLTNSSDEIAAKIEHLYNNPDEFLQMSEEASSSIRKISSSESVVMAELELIASYIKSNL